MAAFHNEMQTVRFNWEGVEIHNQPYRRNPYTAFHSVAQKYLEKFVTTCFLGTCA